MAVSRILSWMIIHLSDIPEDLCRTGCPPSVLSCTARGFSCLANYSASGELLPRLFTLTCLREEQLFFSKNRRCLFCDTFRQRPLSRTLPAYSTRHAAVWCSDFPPANLAIHQRSSAIDAYSSTFRSHCMPPISRRARWIPSSDNRKRNGHELLLSTQ